MTSSALALRPTSNNIPPANMNRNGGGVNLQIGNLNINSKQANAQLEAGLNDGIQAARGLFNKVKSGGLGF